MGQEHIVKTLQSALEAGRIAHAYLFTGPRGTGKTSTARLLAKALNCQTGPTAKPCNECAMCLAVMSGQGGDVIELDAASESGVEDVRNHIVEGSRYAPMEARYKVYIIDEVHDLSTKAFDALLKTIEEPPPHVIFILATTEYSKVPTTIRSRCQKYEFHRGSVRDLVGRLEYVCEQESIQAEKAAIVAIARMADGGFRDALTLLEQAMIRSDQNITVAGVVDQLGFVDDEQVDKMLIAAVEGDVGTVILVADEAVRRGKDPRGILESILYRLSELTYAAYEVDVSEGADPERRAANHAVAVRIGRERLVSFRALIAEAHKEIRQASLPRLWLEVSLLRLIDAAPIAQVVPERKVQAEPSRQTKAVVDTAPQTNQQEPARSAKPAARQKPALPANADAVALRPIWAEAVNRIRTRYKAAGAMLDATDIVGKDGEVIVVGITSKFQYDRIQQKDELREVIRVHFAEAAGDPSCQMRFELMGDQASPEEPSSVQSPVEGEALARLVEDVFQVKPE